MSRALIEDDLRCCVTAAHLGAFLAVLASCPEGRRPRNNLAKRYRRSLNYCTSLAAHHRRRPWNTQQDIAPTQGWPFMTCAFASVRIDRSDGSCSKRPARVGAMSYWVFQGRTTCDKSGCMSTAVTWLLIIDWRSAHGDFKQQPGKSC